VYAALAPQMEGPVHALALHTYSPGEWQQRQGDAPTSPPCLGGSKSASP
jgi:BolA protein